MTALTDDQPLDRRIVHRRPRWMVPLVVVVVAVLGLLAYGVRLSGQGQVERGPAPPFTLKTFDGREISVPDPQGRPVVVNFWASWCIPCRDEAPLLEQTWRDYGGEILFVGVDYVDTEREARAFIAEFNITYPNGPDLGSRISDAYRIRGVPETFFIAPDATVKAVKVGPLASRDELESYLALIR